MTDPKVKTQPRKPSGRSERGRKGAPKRGEQAAPPRSRPLVLVGLASVFVVLSLYATLSSETGRYIPDALLEQSVAPDEYLKRHTYLWDDSHSLGAPASPFAFSPATAAFQSGVSALGARAWSVERLTHALYLSLAALGVILLMCAFRPRIGVEHAIAAFVYAFSPLTSQLLLTSPFLLYYALAPWLAWIALRGIRDDDPWRWGAAFALAIAAGGTTNIPALGFALVPAVLTAIYASLYERRGTEQLWRWIWRAGLLSALTLAPALVLLSLSGPELSTNLRTTELPESVARTSSWFESWRGLGFWLSYPFGSSGGPLREHTAAYFTSADVIVASFIAPIGAVVALALVRWRHRLLFGAILIVSLVLMVGTHEDSAPFGRLLSFTFDHWGLAQGFRTTYKAGPGLMLGIAVLLGVGVAALTATAARTQPRGRRRRHTQPGLRPLWLGLISLGVATGVVVASFPFWTARAYPGDIGFRSIPRYWDQTFGYLSAQEQPGRVLVLPGAGATRYRWGNLHEGLFNGLSPLSPLILRPIPQGTAENANLVAAIDDYAGSRAYVPGTLAPILARLGVRWVVLQNDLDWQSMGAPRPFAYAPLRTDPGLRPVAAFGQPGTNTAAPRDLDAGRIGERGLPPVELYQVTGAPSPRPRLVAGPPILVSGAGDSWPSLAAAGLLDGPPIAYTGAAQDDVLAEMVNSGAEVVVTDGNRRRATASTAERQYQSPTLAPEEPSDREPADLFGGQETQSTATYADAAWITGTRYGFPLSPYEAAARPANAFDGVERTAWTVRGRLDPDGESITVELSKPEDITGISVLPHADGRWWVKAVDVIVRSEDGEETRERLRFDGALPKRVREPLEATGATQIELRIAEVGGRGPVGLPGVGIAEVGVTTPDGPLDLRQFVRTPEDLAARAARDQHLAAQLAARPPRYELRRVFGIPEEETELRREITTFGDHRYRLSATAKVDTGSADSAIESLIGSTVSAVGTSRTNGRPNRRGGLVVDDDLSTGWEPVPRLGERVDVHFPPTEIRTAEVLVVSGPRGGASRSRVTGVEVRAGKGARGHSELPGAPQCENGGLDSGGCLETHVVNLPPTRSGRLSVTLTGIDPVSTRSGEQPPKVVEVRINGGEWSGIGAPAVPEACAPLFAIDGRPIPVRLPGDTGEVLAGDVLELKGCESVRLGPGRHRIETLSGLSGAVVAAGLVPVGEAPPPPDRGSHGKVELLDRSPTELKLRMKAPQGSLLVGGMPAHSGWDAKGGELSRVPVPLDTFEAWTVEAPTDGEVTLQFTPQATYELAIAVSIAAAAWCLWRVTRRRRRRAA